MDNSLRGQLMFPKQVVHGRAADAELQRRPTDVAARSCQRLDNDLTFDTVPRLAKRQAFDGLRDGDAQIGGADDTAPGQDHSALDCIFQLANVPGPRVTQDRIDCLRAEL
jgi:hypothetical protein